jgi:hypothetical protein
MEMEALLSHGDGSTPIAWRSKLQKTIALSIAEGLRPEPEAEYSAASRAAVEVIHLRYLLSAMDFSPSGYTPVYEDNNACIMLRIEGSNTIIGGRERAKHVDIRKHFARDRPEWTPTSDDDSDPGCHEAAEDTSRSGPSLRIG